MKNGTLESREREHGFYVIPIEIDFLREGLSFTCPTCNLISGSDRCAIRCYFEQGH